VSDDLNRNLVRKMFEKQNELNIHTNGSNWKKNTDLKWYRAIWTECAELIDYTNWKWWKAEDISLQDIEMEIIDIWHFIMSELMRQYDFDNCVESTFCKFKNGFKSYPDVNLSRIQNYTEDLAKDALNSRQSLIHHFVKLCGAVGSHMNIQGVYKLYMGKNILNTFRQDNGYKQKIYQKNWDGKEDNTYLMNILKDLDPTDVLFESLVYKELDLKYKSLLRQ